MVVPNNKCWLSFIQANKRSYLAEEPSSPDVRKGPVVVERCREKVVARGVEGQARHGPVMGADELQCLAGAHIPYPDLRVGRGCDDGVLGGMVHDTGHFLAVALQNCNNLVLQNISSVKRMQKQIYIYICRYLITYVYSIIYVDIYVRDFLAVAPSELQQPGVAKH